MELIEFEGNSFRKIHFQRLLDDPMCAVSLLSYEEAAVLLANVLVQLPDNTENWYWDDGDFWANYESETCCYFEGNGNLSLWRKSSLERMGYSIIHIADMYEECPDIQEADVPIDFLMSGVVPK